MEISDLTKRFSDSYENQCKAIFASVFIVGNRLQTIFDNNIPEISLKQFMLLIMIRLFTAEHQEACRIFGAKRIRRP